MFEGHYHFSGCARLLRPPTCPRCGTAGFARRPSRHRRVHVLPLLVRRSASAGSHLPRGAQHQSSDTFCLCWANENWTRVWDGRAPILLEQHYDAAEQEAHPLAGDRLRRSPLPPHRGTAALRDLPRPVASRQLAVHRSLACDRHGDGLPDPYIVSSTPGTTTTTRQTAAAMRPPSSLRTASGTSGSTSCAPACSSSTTPWCGSRSPSHRPSGPAIAAVPMWDNTAAGPARRDRRQHRSPMSTGCRDPPSGTRTWWRRLRQRLERVGGGGAYRTRRALG